MSMDEEITKPDNKGAPAGNSKAVNILKQNGPINPCLGSGVIERYGKAVSECIFLNYEDYNKLVVFSSGQVSNFVEDLI